MLTFNKAVPGCEDPTVRELCLSGDSVLGKSDSGDLWADVGCFVFQYWGMETDPRPFAWNDSPSPFMYSFIILFCFILFNKASLGQ